MHSLVTEARRRAPVGDKAKYKVQIAKHSTHDMAV
jgi:hypothetical protein